MEGEFATALRTERDEHRRQTQRQAAPAVKVSSQQWSNYERGEDLPETEKYPLFAAYLRCSVDEVAAMVRRDRARRARRKGDVWTIMDELVDRVTALEARFRAVGIDQLTDLRQTQREILDELRRRPPRA